jgi:pimeloyl-ACP methyl ester carboxylesterase
MSELTARRFGPRDDDRAPIVVLPGFGVSRYLRAGCADLARRCDRPVLLVDPPGFGPNASALDGPATVPAVADRLVSWLAELGPIWLVGQSTGCALAARLARCDAGLDVAAAALSGPVFDPERATVVDAARGLVLDGVREPWWLGPIEVPEWVGNARVLPRYLRSCLDEPLAQHLEAVRCPVVITRGDRDPLCRHSWAAQLAAAPGRTLVTVPGGSHTYMAAQPEAFATSLIAGGFAMSASL